MIGSFAAAVTFLSCSIPAQGYSLATSYATSYAGNYSSVPMVNDLGYWDYDVSGSLWGGWGWGGYNGWNGAGNWGFTGVRPNAAIPVATPNGEPYRYFMEPPMNVDHVAAEYVKDWGKAGEQHSFARVFTEAEPYGLFKTPLERARKW
jgi:hypothetical protein